MDSLISVFDVNHVLNSIMPYDMVPRAVSDFYESYRELPDVWNTTHITLRHLFHILEIFTRTTDQREAIFDRLAGCLAGMRVADFEVLHAHAQVVLARV
jgi:hypothetical protein